MWNIVMFGQFIYMKSEKNVKMHFKNTLNILKCFFEYCFMFLIAQIQYITQRFLII